MKQPKMSMSLDRLFFFWRKGDSLLIEKREQDLFERMAVFTTDPNIENPILLISMVEDVKNIGGSGYVVQKDKRVLDQYLR